MSKAARRVRAMAEELLLAASPRPSVRDAFLVVVLGGLAVIELVLDLDTSWWFAPAAAIAIAALPFRRLIPAWTAIVPFAALVPSTIIAEGLDVDGGPTFAGTLALVLVVYAAVRWVPGARRWRTLGVLVVLVVVMVLTTAPAVDIVVDVSALFVVAAVAEVMRYRARLAETRQRMTRLSERNDLARELHDSVAHHISAIAVQAQAGQFVADADPTAARQALASIEAEANRSLDEMRRLVGILRSDEDAGRTVLPTSLEDLTATPGEPPIRFEGETSIAELPSPVAAAIYRIAQEGVTNARRHSAAATAIVLDLALDPHQVELIVENDGARAAAASPGNGLTGMRERAESLDGTFEAGPAPNGGWRVRVVIPRERA